MFGAGKSAYPRHVRRAVVLLAVSLACGRVTDPNEESTPPPPPDDEPPMGERATAPYPNIVWVRSFSDTMSILEVEVGKDGAIYVAADRWGGPAAPMGAAASGPVDRLAVSRLSADGVLEWRREFTGTEYTYWAGIDVDAEGNAYVCGTSSDVVDLGLGVMAHGYHGIFAGKLDAEGDTQWSTFLESELASTCGCGLTSKGELVIGVGFTLPEEGQVIGTKLSTDGEVVWTLVNHLPTTKIRDAAAAVGPEDEIYFYWNVRDPLDFGDGIPRYGAPGLVASFTADHELRWTAQAGHRLPASLKATSAGLTINGIDLLPLADASQFFEAATGERTWRWQRPHPIDSGSFEPGHGAWIVGTDFQAEPYAFLAFVGADEQEKTRTALGPSTWGGALARVDDRHLLVGGDYVDGTVIGGEVLEGTGTFLALVETHAP